MKTFSKYLLIGIFAIALGVLTGFLVQKMESNQVEEKFYWGQWDSDTETLVVPLAFLKGSLEHDFGAVEKGQLLTFDFVIENQGSADLEIWIDQQPEGAVTVDLGSDKQIIRPSFTYPVTVTLDTDKVDSELESKITVMTNEERKSLVLTIRASPANN